ncbi:trans-resveratrol di-O-methyltransferase-like [Lotus japonicus]|uniref:isoflavone 7-O-methyltransferase n=1 Tax=Lotus japonicus TaxID=34305 RepID=I3SKV8_LOTJA|nr:trans-resveratrol di-O-methyltransferase-like [Lotus japonicus]AFK40900.1 unknown [Lotus japonicus]
MEFKDGENAAKLLRAQSHIWNHILSYINSMSLKCVVDLGIPDIIHNYGKPMPLSKLIASLPIHSSKAGNIPRLMRVMIHSGFFSQHNITENELEVEYTLTDDSILLLKGHPFSILPFLLCSNDPILKKPWHHLSTWFKNDDLTPFETAHGMLPWDYANRDPKVNNLLNESMACDAQLIAGVFIEKCKDMLNGLESLVDVGGGTGTMARAIAKSFPRLKCTVFDLPHVVADLQGSENLEYIGGDMFKEIPPADAILLKWILHDWSDEECLKILKNCKEAIKSKGKEGKVIIIDMVIEEDKGDDKSVETQLLFDMGMMVLTTGKERSMKEWGILISSAGFSDYKISPVLGLRSVVEIYP